MNTHDMIELPPMPTPDADHYDSGTFAPVWKKGKMEVYGKQCYQAGVEADRKRWGDLEAQLEEALTDRDDYHDMADQLAEQIAAITEQEIGEHSNGNNPWQNAMLAADEWIIRRLTGGVDRKRRGEPVAWATFADNGNIRIWVVDPIQAEALRRHYGDQLKPICAAPQPAEPVVNQSLTTAASDVLADTQRAIIEAAERRGYARAIAECAQDREDAERFRWLTEDHTDAETRTRCREILDRMAVMSYSAACVAIDHARRIAAQSQPSGNPGELPVVNQSLTTESDREAMADEFEAWWINVGQYLPACRGANYKKTFAYRAYEHAYDVGFRAALAQQPSGQALEDAERYRWLRDPCSGAEHIIFYSRGDYGKGLMSGEMLDAAIDAARAAKERT